MPCPVLVLQNKQKKKKKSARTTQKHTQTHTGVGMVRFHLLSLPLPLISHSKQLPKIVTVDNIFKYNILYFTISSRCFIWTPKAILPAEKKSCLLAFCGSGQQEEIFYSMAATIVRLEDNSYRQSWKEAEAVLSCHSLCLQERYNPFPVSLTYVQACSVHFFFQFSPLYLVFLYCLSLKTEFLKLQYY